MSAAGHDQRRYAPFYCEENVWHLAKEGVGGDPSFVVFISNPQKSCALWAQRSASSADMPVLWDYHVILVSAPSDGALVWDLDTRLGFPVRLRDYLDGTFPYGEALRETLLPRFRVLPAATYVERFASDRSHMHEGDDWRAPPPEWPTIGEGMNLFDFVDTEREFAGEVGGLPWLRRHEWK